MRKPQRATASAKTTAHLELTDARPSARVSLVLLDLEVTIAARTERTLCLGLDDGGGRNLDWTSPRGPRFELEQLLRARASGSLNKRGPGSSEAKVGLERVMVGRRDVPPTSFF